MNVSELVKQEAKRVGVTDSKAIKKAVKMINNGKFNTADLAMKMGNMFQQKSDDPRERLRQKLRDKRQSRSSKTAINVMSERKKQATLKRKEEREENEKIKRKMLKNKKQRHKKKLKQLEKKLGNVSIELYTGAQKKINEKNYKDEADKNRYQNIIDLYVMQQKMSENDKELELEVELNELSDLSDLDDEDL
jgi:hypothetical protein